MSMSVGRYISDKFGRVARWCVRRSADASDTEILMISARDSKQCASAVELLLESRAGEV